MRPRQNSDQELVELAAAAIARRRGGAWSLADVARDSGVHSATYIKRFGSKKGLTLAISRRWIDSIPGAPRTADPLRELSAWVMDSYGSFADPALIAGNLAALTLDLGDPELRASLAEGWRAQAGYARSLLTDAESAGDLTRLPGPDAAAAVLLAAAEGAVIRWFAAPAAPLPDALESILSTLLTSWR